MLKGPFVFSFEEIVRVVSYFRPAAKMPILFEIPVEQTRGFIVTFKRVCWKISTDKNKLYLRESCYLGLRSWKTVSDVTTGDPNEHPCRRCIHHTLN